MIRPQETRLMPTETHLVFPPFQRAPATVRRSMGRASAPISGRLRRTTETMRGTEICTTVMRPWAGTTTTASTSVFLSVVFAIKKTLSKTGCPTKGGQPVLTF